VEQTVLSPLVAWESFYVIVGSSAAALTGLQFVVMTLSAGMNTRGGETVTNAFSTPTIVHFCVVLFISAIVSAPWPALSSVGLVLGASGVAGLVYTLIVIQRTQRQTLYVPVFEDWLFHAVLPLIAYAALLVAAVFLWSYPTLSLFVIGGVALLLLFVGIHNAWDGAVYIALRRQRQQQTEGRGDKGEVPE
jgi:hypothetical protein